MHWLCKLDGAPKRVNHAAAAYGDKIFSFGGYSELYDSKDLRPMDVYELNTATLRWKRLHPEDNSCKEDVPYERYGHTAVTFEDSIYIWGGRNDESTSCSTLFRFDPNAVRWTRPVVEGAPPSPRDGHSANVCDGHMYVFGGCDASEVCLQDVHALDLVQMAWSPVHAVAGQPPCPRDFHASVAIGRRLYVFGGRSYNDFTWEPEDFIDETYDPHVFYFDLDTGVWHRPRQYGDVPVGRRSHSAFVYMNKMYIFGGYNERHFNDLRVFDPVKCEWTELVPLGEFPCRRRRQPGVLVKDRLYIFGGTCSIDETDDEQSILMNLGDMYVLDFAPSLKTLSLLTVIKTNQNLDGLPKSLRFDISSMMVPNKIDVEAEPTR